MKTTMHLLAVITAALSLNLTTAVGQVSTSVEVSKNRAFTASPRAKEEFPWLTPRGTDPILSKKAALLSRSMLALVKENPALATSPRMKELFPELARPAMSSRDSAVATHTGINPLTAVRRNSALAASPRMKELYPELARGAEKTPAAPVTVSTKQPIKVELAD